jgi:hypothetical protein
MIARTISHIAAAASTRTADLAEAFMTYGAITAGRRGLLTVPPLRGAPLSPGASGRSGCRRRPVSMGRGRRTDAIACALLGDDLWDAADCRPSRSLLLRGLVVPRAIGGRCYLSGRQQLGPRDRQYQAWLCCRSPKGRRISSDITLQPARQVHPSRPDRIAESRRPRTGGRTG